MLGKCEEKLKAKVASFIKEVNECVRTMCDLCRFSSLVGRLLVGLSHSVSQEKSGKRASPYQHGESVVIAFLL